MARVLVIDDDELFVKLMCHSLKQKGHTVEFALDGQQGWKAFCAGQFDLVICDIVMPQQEGFETIKRMRQQNADVGIVAISGGAEPRPAFEPGRARHRVQAGRQCDTQETFSPQRTRGVRRARPDTQPATGAGGLTALATS